jgi:signal transduction histidine kinase
VSDFVARELRGQFDVISSPGRGTTARVQFPLLEDESHGRGL